MLESLDRVRVSFLFVKEYGKIDTLINSWKIKNWIFETNFFYLSSNVRLFSTRILINRVRNPSPAKNEIDERMVVVDQRTTSTLYHDVWPWAEDYTSLPRCRHAARRWYKHFPRNVRLRRFKLRKHIEDKKENFIRNKYCIGGYEISFCSNETLSEIFTRENHK